MMVILHGIADFVKKKIKISKFTLFLQILSIVFQKIVIFVLIKESTKIVPPIILLLVDISGSMTSSIYTDLWTKS
jgi:hypothetical protein